MTKDVEQTLLQGLTPLIEQRLQTAQTRFQNAEQEHMKRYYKGQVDALLVVFGDIAHVKFEMGEEINLETIPLETAAPTPEPIEKPENISTEKKTERKKPLKNKTASKSQPSVSPQETLAKDAIKYGIIEQKASHFYHELFPDQHIKGFALLFKTLENDESLRQTLEDAVQSAQAHSSSSEVSTDPHENESISEEAA